MTQCARQHGMCGHEKTMLIVMVITIIGGSAYWLLT
jgi:hypothetical protein